MDQQDDIESLWQRVYNSTRPDVVLAEFFNHNPPGERERLLRRCYETGEQFGIQLEQQELTWCTALAHIYTFGLSICSAQQLQITPSPAVAGLIKDRRYQLYSSIQRRPGWRQFPYNITPSSIWRFKNKKDYLGQEILRLYAKLAYRTPDFDTALAILRREYQSRDNKKLTKPALTKIVDELPATVLVLQSFDAPGPPAAGTSHGRNNSSNIDVERQRRRPRESLSGDDISNAWDAHSSPPSEQDDLPNNPDHLPDLSVFSDNIHTGTPATRRSSSILSRLGDQPPQPKNMISQGEQQRKRPRPVPEDLLEAPASAFERVITDAITIAKQYDRLAVELSHLEVTLRDENSGIVDLQSRWQAACTARSRAETNLAAQKEIYTSLQEDGNSTQGLKEDMTGLLDRWESRVLELGHHADALKTELDESEERVNDSRDIIEEKVSKMMKIGQDWGWSGRHSQVYEAYRWIGKTFGKEGAEDRCKEIHVTTQLAGSSAD